MLVVGFGASALPGALASAAAAGQLGGFILFRRNIEGLEQVRELNRALRAACPPRFPPFIGVDEEGGRVSRLPAPVLRLPPMRTLGRIDDTALTQRAARHLGRQLRALGFTIDFAPVLDVDSNPDNPVIGDRSFGATPAVVERHGRAFARGLREAGLLACGKHFPGHGDTHLDSHLALPRVRHDRQRLDDVELAPFAALCGELPALMTAHVVFDALDAEHAATLSRPTAHDLLRRQLGFSGVLFSDDLRMGAIADALGSAEAACAAVEAGCDVVLICDDPDASLSAHAALCRRAERDQAFLARLREAAARSLSLRRSHAQRAPSGAALDDALDPGAARALEEQIAIRAGS